MDHLDYLIRVDDLQTYFFMSEGIARAVDGASLSIKRGQVLGVVGESGCGKSVTARSIMRMVQPPGRTIGGSVMYQRRQVVDQARPKAMAAPKTTGAGEATATEAIEAINLIDLPPMGNEMRSIRGGEIAMIFQEPRASLSPVHTVGDQITENILLHQAVSETEAWDQAIDMLRQVNIPKPAQRMQAYPHQLSGGMCQRVMIAMALSCHPSLLIADEPTTALDVTTEAQILELMQKLQDEFNMAIMFITHDLGVVAEMADEVVVMYLGKAVEKGPVEEIFYDPKHPYTIALLESLPRLEQRKDWLETIRGVVPDPYTRLKGCPFHPRCADFMPGLCDEVEPPPIPLGAGREVRCLLYGEYDKPEFQAVVEGAENRAEK